MTDAEFKQLDEQYNRPSLGGRLMQGLANVPSYIAQGVADTGTGAINLLMLEDSKLPEWSQHIPQPFEIPTPRNWSEAGADFIPNMASLLPQILVPETAAASILSRAGVAPRLASIIGSGFGNALPGLQEGGAGEAAALGGIGATQTAANFLPRSARIPLALAAGLGAGALDYASSHDPARAGAIGVLNAALPFLPRQIIYSVEMPQPYNPRPMVPELPGPVPENMRLPMYGTPYGKVAANAEITPQTGRPMPVVPGDVTFDFETMRMPQARRVEGTNPFRDDLNPRHPVIDAEFSPEGQLLLRNGGGVPINPTEGGMQRGLFDAPEVEGDIFATLQKKPTAEPPVSPSLSGKGRGPKITKDDYDILDKFTEKNRLRLVPEKGREGFLTFETLQDVPKVGKVQFEVPEGTSVAQANKLYKEAKKGKKIATLQKPVEGEGTVPFADVPSRDIDISKFAHEVERGQSFKEGTPVTLRDSKTGMTKKVDYDRLGRTQQEALETIAGAGLGAAYGYNQDDENRIRGMFMGAVAGAGIPQSLRFLVNPRARIAEAQKLGVFAGQKAYGFEAAEAEGKIFKGLDDQKRFEISDIPSKYRAKYEGEAKLSEVLEHPELYGNYPGIGENKIRYEELPSDKLGYVDQEGTVVINSLRGAKEQHSTLLHEVQHLIQAKEGFARGGGTAAYNKAGFSYDLKSVNEDIKHVMSIADQYDPEAYSSLMDMLIKKKRYTEQALRAHNDWDYYQKLAGEVEAREVQYRQDLRQAGAIEAELGQPMSRYNKDDFIFKYTGRDASFSQGAQGQPQGMRNLKKSTAGFLDDEVLRLIGSVVGGGLAGGYVDEENRLRGMVLGAMLGGGFSKYGPELLDWMAGVKKGGASLKGKGFKGGFESLAKEAALGGQGTLPKLARAFEKMFTTDPTIKDLVTKSGGETALAAEQIGDALSVLRAMRDKLTPADSSAIMDYFTSGNIATLQSKVSNADAIGAATTAREVATRLQETLVEGMSDTKLKKKIVDSFDKYLTRAYKIFNDPKYNPTDVQIQAVADELQRAFPTMGPDIALAKVRDYVHETLSSRALLKTSKAAYSGSRTTTGQSLDEILKIRKDLRNRPAFRDLLGEYTDPVEMMAATAAKLIPAARTAKFYDDVADTITDVGNKFTYVQEEWQKTLDALRKGPKDIATLQKIDELEGYVPIGESERYGKLANRMVHRRVRDQLSSYDSPWGLAENNVIKGMVDLHTLVKTGRTVLNPITVLRNILTIPFFSQVAGAGGPGHWKQAYKLIRLKGKDYEEMMVNGILSADQVKGEFFKDIGHVLRGNPDATLAGKVFDAGLDKAMEFYRIPDLVIRASTYLNQKAKYLKQGLSQEDAIAKAVRWTNRYTMNYDAISPGIRAIRQLPFFNIFMSYASEIVRITKNLTWDALGKGEKENQIKAMGLLAGIPALFAGAQYVSEQALSPKDREEWERTKSLMPAYNRNNYYLVSGRLPDGTFKYYNVSPLFIADDFGKMFRGLANGDVEAFAANNPIIGWENTPLLNVVSEAVTGRDRRTGQRIDGIVGRLDEARKEFLPPLLGGYALDNIAKALTPNEKGEIGIIDPATGRRFGWETILNEFGISAIPGARTSFIQPKYLERAAQFEAQERIQALQSKQRQIQRSNASKEVKAKAAERTQEEIKSILQELKTKLGRAPQGVQ